jgi:catechol 2,3-dioxygenase-like lactoylglutathione lyase family enzyme
MRITRLNHVGINATGHEQAVREFYLSFLGMHDMERNAVAARVKGFWAGTDWPIVHVVTEPAEGGPAMALGPHLSLFVDNIDEAIREVQARTTEVLLTGEGPTRIVWFRDPAGNTVELQQDPQLPCAGTR